MSQCKLKTFRSYREVLCVAHFPRNMKGRFKYSYIQCFDKTRFHCVLSVFIKSSHRQRMDVIQALILEWPGRGRAQKEVRVWSATGVNWSRNPLRGVALRAFIQSIMITSNVFTLCIIKISLFFSLSRDVVPTGDTWRGNLINNQHAATIQTNMN